VHRFQSISKAVIHLGVDKHHVVDGKCKESMNKTRWLIVKEVDRTPNAKIFVISLSVRKTFVATHLFNESGDGLVELLKGEQLK
jgi:hypothetical protein